MGNLTLALLLHLVAASTSLQPIYNLPSSFHAEHPHTDTTYPRYLDPKHTVRRNLQPPTTQGMAFHRLYDPTPSRRRFGRRILDLDPKDKNARIQGLGSIHDSKRAGCISN